MNKNQKPLRQITFVIALSMALIGGSFAQPQSEKKAIQTAQTQSTPAQSNKITITAPPSANRDSDSAAKKSDKVGSTEPQGTDFRLKVTDTFLAAFTAMLVIVGILQTIILFKTTTHFKIVERAYIKMSHRPPGIETEGITGLFGVTLEIANFGKTPARVTDVFLTHVVVPHKKGLPKIPDYQLPAVRDNIPSAFLVTEDKFFFAQSFRIPKVETISIMELESDLYLIGFVDYVDQFKQRHRGGCARLYQPRMDDRSRFKTDDAFQQRSNLVFVAQDGYNYDRPRVRGEGNDWTT
jgi:hypothetical protein